jgi:hypothetical protein
MKLYKHPRRYRAYAAVPASMHECSLIAACTSCHLAASRMLLYLSVPADAGLTSLPLTKAGCSLGLAKIAKVGEHVARLQ